MGPPGNFWSGHKEKQAGAMSSMLQVCHRIWRLQEEIRDLEQLVTIHDAIRVSLHGPVWWVESRRVLVDERRELETGSAKSSSGSGRKPRPTYYTLTPEGFGAGAANVVGRCLMDNVQDEVFILQQIREHVPAHVYVEVKRALDNSVRSRHVGTELIRVAKDIEKAAP